MAFHFTCTFTCTLTLLVALAALQLTSATLANTTADYAFIKEICDTFCPHGGTYGPWGGWRCVNFPSYSPAGACDYAGTGNAWLGINCNGGGTRVVSMDQSTSRYGTMKAQIPNSITTLEFLQTIRWPAVYLVGELPSGLGDVISLRTIDFNDNNLTGTIPANWGKLGNLTRLQLANNNFSNGCFPSGPMNTSLSLTGSTCDLRGMSFCCGFEPPAKCNALPCDPTCSNCVSAGGETIPTFPANRCYLNGTVDNSPAPSPTPTVATPGSTPTAATATPGSTPTTGVTPTTGAATPTTGTATPTTAATATPTGVTPTTGTATPTDGGSSPTIPATPVSGPPGGNNNVNPDAATKVEMGCLGLMAVVGAIFLTSN